MRIAPRCVMRVTGLAVEYCLAVCDRCVELACGYQRFGENTIVLVTAGEYYIAVDNQPQCASRNHREACLKAIPMFRSPCRSITRFYYPDHPIYERGRCVVTEAGDRRRHITSSSRTFPWRRYEARFSLFCWRQRRTSKSSFPPLNRREGLLLQLLAEYQRPL
jgi:hypothetical protein